MQFKRLFALDMAQDVTVADKTLWEDGKATWRLAWRHQLRGRETGELAELLKMLQAASLSPDKLDD